ncbi:hypothetical protein [Clostridium senegalense]|uniref:hypothetical protein n=1 Tax=Clostridium senegalense TaxID=1465809 RepID=UPI001C105BD7|nr:hypothetical protein [Clostridium senegalense]MBU5227374.1 hypothetical protein [Clostridium senegalense]
MEELEKLLNILVDFFIVTFKKINIFLVTYYDKLLFYFNKQNTIKKMYEPSIKKRIEKNNKLNITLKEVKLEEYKLNDSIKNNKDKLFNLEKKMNIIEDYINNNLL